MITYIEFHMDDASIITVGTWWENKFDDVFPKRGQKPPKLVQELFPTNDGNLYGFAVKNNLYNV